MTGQELTLGSIGISVILSILLRMVYNTFAIPNKFKPWIAVFLGMALAIVVMLSTGAAVAFAVVATYLVQGFMTGATAVGMYEMTKQQAPAG